MLGVLNGVDWADLDGRLLHSLRMVSITVDEVDTTANKAALYKTVVQSQLAAVQRRLGEKLIVFAYT